MGIQAAPACHQAATYYSHNSFSLHKKIDALKVLSDASLFTIDTNNCIERLSNFLRSAACKAAFTHLVVEALIKALVMVMKNNRMKAKDLIVLQLICIAMGMLPAPTTTNLYVAFLEIAEVLT
ncbi:hypothetical protein ACHAWF_005091 [Thalassiosira exigua]